MHFGSISNRGTACCVGTVDRLTMLGPRPVIASLSLGATRTFRLRCMATQDTQVQTYRQQQEHGRATAPSQSQTQHANHTPLLASSAQPMSHKYIGSQHVEQRQENSISGSQGAVDNGTCAQPAAQPESIPAAAQQSQQEASLSSIDVMLPHNTLVIMWPPMQEAWKHEVPGPLCQ